jgi:cytochrome c biogenesis protein CcmG/thiol:disulfide interchange protein DsbE
VRARHRAPLALLGVLVLTGCGGSLSAGAEDEAWFARPAPTHTPLSVKGVASCSQVPQQPLPAAADTGRVDSERVEVGQRLPALSLPCLTPGPEVDLAAVGGTPVLVNLWASWCDPCLREMPLLQQAYTDHSDDVEFVGVDTKDRAEAAAAFLDTVDVTYPQLVDLDGALLRSTGVPGLPVTLMLDADGRLAARHVGELDEAGLAELLGSVGLVPGRPAA